MGGDPSTIEWLEASIECLQRDISQRLLWDNREATCHVVRDEHQMPHVDIDRI
jgi:hypothetical protein